MDGTALPDRARPDGPGYGVERVAPAGVAVDRHRDRGLDLTPEERAARRNNRRLMLMLVIPSIVILVLALIATSFYWSNEPSGPKIAPPRGFQAVSDGYFTYAVPDSWSNNQEFTDNAGDIETSGPTGWAGEHRAYRFKPPVLGETPPASLQAFGMPRPEQFQLTGGHPVAVKGAASAFEYVATRPGGFRATVIDAWSSRTGVEVWLMVQAPAAVTQTLVSSLQA